MTADLNLDLEHALEALRPGHGCVTLGWRLVVGVIRRAAVVAFTALGRRHERPMPAVGGEHAVEAHQVHARFGYQGGQASDEVQGLEDDMRGAVTVGGSLPDNARCHWWLEDEKDPQAQFPGLDLSGPPYWNPITDWEPREVYAIKCTPPDEHPYCYKIVYFDT